MKHDEAEPMLGAAALGELSPEDAAALVPHLAECAACRDALAAMKETFALLEEGLAAAPEVELEPERRAAVFAGLNEGAAGAEPHALRGAPSAGAPSGGAPSGGAPSGGAMRWVVSGARLRLVLQVAAVLALCAVLAGVLTATLRGIEGRMAMTPAGGASAESLVQQDFDANRRADAGEAPIAISDPEPTSDGVVFRYGKGAATPAPEADASDVAGAGGAVADPFAMELPLLGDLPQVGRLFERGGQRRERPTVVSKAGAAADEGTERGRTAAAKAEAFAGALQAVNRTSTPSTDRQAGGGAVAQAAKPSPTVAGGAAARDKDPFAESADSFATSGDPFAGGAAPFAEPDDPFAAFGPVSGEEPTLTMDFDQIPLDALLDYVCKGAGLTYRVEEHAVVISDPDCALDSMETRIYPVDDRLLDGQDPQAFLEGVGVEFPTGAKLSYNRATERLVVTNTSGNIGRTEQVLNGLGVDVPDPKPETRPLREKLAQITVPKVQFEDASLSAVLKYLKSRSKELDPDGVGVNLFYADASPPAAVVGAGGPADPFSESGKAFGGDPFGAPAGGGGADPFASDGSSVTVVSNGAVDSLLDEVTVTADRGAADDTGVIAAPSDDLASPQAGVRFGKGGVGGSGPAGDAQPSGNNINGVVADAKEDLSDHDGDAVTLELSGAVSSGSEVQWTMQKDVVSGDISVGTTAGGDMTATFDEADDVVLSAGQPVSAMAENEEGERVELFQYRGNMSGQATAVDGRGGGALAETVLLGQGYVNGPSRQADLGGALPGNAGDADASRGRRSLSDNSELEVRERAEGLATALAPPPIMPLPAVDAPVGGLAKATKESKAPHVAEPAKKRAERKREEANMAMPEPDEAPVPELKMEAVLDVVADKSKLKMPGLLGGRESTRRDSAVTPKSSLPDRRAPEAPMAQPTPTPPPPPPQTSPEESLCDSAEADGQEVGQMLAGEPLRVTLGDRLKGWFGSRSAESHARFRKRQQASKSQVSALENNRRAAEATMAEEISSIGSEVSDRAVRPQDALAARLPPASGRSTVSTITAPQSQVAAGAVGSDEAAAGPEALLQKARAARQRGDAEAAEGALTQLLVDYPKASAARVGKALLASIRTEQAEREAAEDAGPLPAVPKRPPPPVNPFVMTASDRFSTFALEADTAAYTMTRRFLRRGYRPPPAIVRMEEFINAFDYHYPPQTARTFTVHPEAAPAPFGKDLTLLKVGVKGKVLGRDGRKPAHLVFVVDASGSMARGDRMPLVKYALRLLLNELDARDRVTLIAYGTQARLLAEAVPATDRERLREAVEAVECSSSTNLMAGVELGYAMAARHFRPGTINRVILCSDGVANVGETASEALLEKVASYRRQGVSFTSVGVGAGSYDDRMLEELANKGDGNYVFIDTRAEARRVFSEELSGTLQMIARDVKIQVEFNPRKVRRYRLIGYENRAVADKDFRNDAIDAGEIGSGQSATALYELELLDDPAVRHEDLGTVFVRYKDVDDSRVEEIATRLEAALVRERTVADSPRLMLAACAAEFAEILRESEHARDGDLKMLEQVMIRVANALPLDSRVAELLRLVRKAQGLPVAR